MYSNPEIETLFESDNLDEIGYLLRNGLNVNSLNNIGTNAIFMPECTLEKTKFLINHGIDFKFTTKKGINALSNYHNRSQPFDKFKFLVEKGVNYQQIADYCVTDCVFNNCSIEIAEYLFKHLNFDIHRKNEYGFNLLNSSNREVCEFLVRQNVDIFHISKDDFNTLFLNDKDTLEYLVGLGVDPFHISKNTKESVLFYTPSLRSTQYLCDLGVPVNHKNKDGQTCLMNLGYKSLKYLVQEKGADIHALDKNDSNILYHQSDDINIIKFALSHNVDILDENDEYHLTNMPHSFIPKACKAGLLQHPDFYKILFTPKAITLFHNPKYDMEALYLYIKEYINHGGNINILNPENNYNLLMTYGEKSEKIANFLVENGIDMHYHIRNLSVLDRCKFSSTYQLLKDKGFFTDKRFHIIREIFDFSSFEYIGIRNEDILKDLFKQNLKFDNPDILCHRYPRYQIKNILKAGLKINPNMDYSKALYCQSEKKNYRYFLSLIYHDVSPNYIYCENSEDPIDAQNDKNIILNIQNDLDNKKEKNTYSIFDCLLSFPERLQKYTLFIFKYLIKYGLSLQEMQKSEHWNQKQITKSFYKLLQNCNEKIEIINMIKEDINFLEFSVFASDKEIVKYLMFNFNVSDFSEANQKSLLAAGLQYLEEGDLKYYQQMNLLADILKKQINNHIKMIGIKTVSKSEKCASYQKKENYTNKEFEIDKNQIDSTFLDNNMLEEKHIILPSNMHKLSVREENCLFYITDFQLISAILDKGVNIGQISMEGFNCVNFRIVEIINAKQKQIAPEQINILSLLISKGIDPYQPSHYPYCVMDNLKDYNEDMYNQIQIIIDKYSLTKIRSDAPVLTPVRL